VIRENNFRRIKEQGMKIGKLTVETFKIRNRKGYAALCSEHLTEGRTSQEAFKRMFKALRRTGRVPRGKA
jgi:hypothetical protein